MRRISIIALTVAVSLSSFEIHADCLKTLKNLESSSQISSADKKTDEVNELMRTVISPDTNPQEKSQIREKLKTLLELDDLNLTYFISLFDRKLHPLSKEPISLHVEGSDANITAYPVQMAPEEMRSKFKYENYDDLKSSGYASYAKETTLWQKKLNAGSGSSLTRSKYLLSKLGVATEIRAKDGKVPLGAKATDLFVTLENPLQKGSTVEVSLAEMQVLQAIHDRDQYGNYVVSDVVGPETSYRMSEIWKKKSLRDPQGRSYENFTNSLKGIEHFDSVYQAFVPTITASDALSFSHTAPAGHALFAVDAIRGALHPETWPATTNGNLIGVISNGEDPNSLADPAVVGWMIKKEIPITLITTEKTSIDKKGGLLCLIKNKESGEVYLKVLETAEAKAAGQLELFESLGGFASTNLTLFNYKILNEKLKNIPEETLMKIITPDLISNSKTKNIEGKDQTFIQLEGAMGSTIMNLDRYWRKTHGEPLVYIVNVDKARRTEQFSPIKTAFDYFMQFHSDRFKFKSASMRLENLRPKTLPSVTLLDPRSDNKFYQDVSNVLDAFKDAKILGLDELSIKGQVRLSALELHGYVKIESEFEGTFDLANYFMTQRRSPVLKDVNVSITKDGQVVIK